MCLSRMVLGMVYDWFNYHFISTQTIHGLSDDEYRVPSTSILPLLPHYHILAIYKIQITDIRYPYIH